MTNHSRGTALPWIFMATLILAWTAYGDTTTHSIEGGTGSTSSAVGATVVGEVYSNRFTMTGSSDSYELGIQAVIDQTGKGTSSSTWQTGGIISRTVALAADPFADTCNGVFYLGASSVFSQVSKTNDLGKAHSEARIRTAAMDMANPQYAIRAISGMAEINATSYFTGLGSGTANASARGNASYNVKQNTVSDIPIQIWGTASGETKVDVTSAPGGNAAGQSSIRAGSSVESITGEMDRIDGSAAGSTNGPIMIYDGKGPAIIAPVDNNQISSEVYASRNYDGYSAATTSAKSGVAESGAWDGSVNQANPRTRRATENVYSGVQGNTSARAQTYLGGDVAGADFISSPGVQTGRTAASIKSLIIHYQNGIFPLYTSYFMDPADPGNNGFGTNATSQRVTPGVDSNKVTSEAFISGGSTNASGRDELPDTTVYRLLNIKAAGANFGSGAHLVNQATGLLTSDAYSYFGGVFVLGTGGMQDAMRTTHAFEVNVAGPAMTGNVMDDAGSYGIWGTQAGSAASNQSMSRPTYDGLNGYASMVTSIAGENAVGWLSGDDSRFHMEARGASRPVISDPTYELVPVENSIFTDLSTEPKEKKINLATSRSDKLTRAAAGAEFQPANP